MFFYTFLAELTLSVEWRGNCPSQENIPFSDKIHCRNDYMGRRKRTASWTPEKVGDFLKEVFMMVIYIAEWVFEKCLLFSSTALTYNYHCRKFYIENFPKCPFIWDALLRHHTEVKAKRGLIRSFWFLEKHFWGIVINDLQGLSSHSSQQGSKLPSLILASNQLPGSLRGSVN